MDSPVRRRFELDEARLAAAEAATVRLSGTVNSAIVNIVSSGVAGGLASVSHDGSLYGLGTPETPLGVVAAALYNMVTVAVDGVTVTGDGTSGNPLVSAAPGLTFVSHDSTLAGLGTVVNTLSASPLSGTINSAIVNLSGSIDGHFTALSGTVNNAIAAISGGTNLVVDSYIWSGGRVSYQNGIPLVVGAFPFDPSVTDKIVGSSASFAFLANAACNMQNVTGSVQLYNVTDGYQICTASFAGTTKVDQTINLSTGGSASYNVPNSLKDYEVRLYVSGTGGNVPLGSSMELYSAGVRARLSGVLGGGNVTQAFSGSIDSSIKFLSSSINPGRFLDRQRLTATTGTYVPHPGARMVIVRMVAGGGGGGGGRGGAAVSAGGGGSSGQWLELSVSSSVDLTGGGFACGGGGNGGSGASPSDGSAGQDTSLVINGILYTVTGGGGGGSTVNTSSNAISAGGAGNLNSTGDFWGWDPGGPGIMLGTVAVAGNGGSSPFGGGGKWVTAGGYDGTGYGHGGGGGANNGVSNENGGSGGPGIIIIDEFTY